jgi:hypothetical protein
MFLQQLELCKEYQLFLAINFNNILVNKLLIVRGFTETKSAMVGKLVLYIITFKFLTIFYKVNILGQEYREIAKQQNQIKD